MDTISLVIIGIYTIAYIIVIFIQNNRIKSAKDTIDSMKTSMESMKTLIQLFDPDKLKKISDMRDEANRLMVKNLIKDESKINEIFSKTAEEYLSKNGDLYFKIKDEEFIKDHGELISFAVNAIKKTPKEQRQVFVDHFLPRTKNTILGIISDSEQQKIL